MECTVHIYTMLYHKISAYMNMKVNVLTTIILKKNKPTSLLLLTILQKYPFIYVCIYTHVRSSYLDMTVIIVMIF